MKRNIILLAVFIVLLTIVNIFFKESEEQFQKNNLISQTSFNELVLPNYTIQKNGQIYYLKDSLIPVDVQMLNTVWDYLKKFKIVSQLKEGELSQAQLEDYLAEKIEITIIENGLNLNITFGKLNPYTNTIFCKILNSETKIPQYYFVIDENPAPRAYGDETQASTQKYQVLKTLLQLEKNKITDNTIFPENILTDLAKIQFNTENKKEFVLDIANKKTIPEVASGILYLEEKMTSMPEYLISFKAEEVIAGYKNLLGKEVAKLNLVNKAGAQKMFTLHEGYQGQPGFYVSSNFQQFIYKLKATDKDFFYLIPQDFWDLNFKLPIIEKSVVFKNKNKTQNLDLADSQVGEWLKLISTQGIMAEDFILFTDQFRKPSENTKIFEIEHAGVKYEFYFDRVTWYVSHPILKGYFTFNKNQIPSQLEMR